MIHARKKPYSYGFLSSKMAVRTGDFKKFLGKSSSDEHG